ncbi:MFS transporter [Arthrobacter sp. NPDC092385]|uniref:MFS transporter n=1 Tax=Arthrobacter sp. NPDC092385 TaxID=3363943 RepID=UPI003808E68E
MPTVPPGKSRAGWLVDTAPLRESPAYARMWLSGVISGIGSNATIVAVGIHMYDLTQSTFAVALVGAFALGPMILVGIFGGAVVDAFDRRRVLVIVSVIAWLSTVGLAVVAWLGVRDTTPYYALTTLSAASSTLVGTARFAIHPRLVVRPLLPAAAALSGISAGLQATIGPAMAGILVATVGFAWTYSVDVLLYVVGILGIVSLPAIPPARDAPRFGLAAVRSGFQFLLAARNIRMAFFLHMVAMSFGRPQVLFPALGATLLGGGALTVGLLTTAGAVGVLLSSALSRPLGTVRRQGLGIIRATSCAGLAISALGILLVTLAPGNGTGDPNIPAIALAAVLLCAWGAADNVAGIFRTTMLQTAAPDDVRGRMQGLFTVLLTAGPRLGDVFMGSIATIAALWFPPVLGGLLIVALVALFARPGTSFRHYDTMDPTP